MCIAHVTGFPKPSHNPPPKRIFASPRMHNTTLTLQNTATKHNVISCPQAIDQCQMFEFFLSLLFSFPRSSFLSSLLSSWLSFSSWLSSECLDSRRLAPSRRLQVCASMTPRSVSARGERLESMRDSQKPCRHMTQEQLTSMIPGVRLTARISPHVHGQAVLYSLASMPLQGYDACASVCCGTHTDRWDI